MLRVGLFGIGLMGRNHFRVLSRLPSAQIVGVEDLTLPPENLVPVELFRGPGELVLEELDCAIVATPTTTHAEVAASLARVGVPTLIEKPLSDSAISSRVIAEEFQEKGVLGFVGFIERFNPAIKKAKELVDSNKFGRLLQISTVREGPQTRKARDVGCVLDLATHDLDLAMYLSSSGYSEIHASIARSSSGAFEDLMVASGKLENGTLCSHRVNWVSESKSRKAQLICEKASIFVDMVRSTLELQTLGDYQESWDSVSGNSNSAQEFRQTRSYTAVEPLESEISEFLRQVEAPGGTTSLASLEQGVIVSELAEKILSFR